MACCLTAPSHHLNQCWMIISEVQWHSYQGNFTRDASTMNHWNPFENYTSKISFKFPRGQWVKLWLRTLATENLPAQQVKPVWLHALCHCPTGISLSMGAANERRRYIATSSFIGWTHIQNYPCPSEIHSTCLILIIENFSSWFKFEIFAWFSQRLLQWNGTHLKVKTQSLFQRSIGLFEVVLMQMNLKRRINEMSMCKTKKITWSNDVK